jgi:hypothetical protein
MAADAAAATTAAPPLVGAAVCAAVCGGNALLSTPAIPASAIGRKESAEQEERHGSSSRAESDPAVSVRADCVGVRPSAAAAAALPCAAPSAAPPLALVTLGPTASAASRGTRPRGEPAAPPITTGGLPTVWYRDAAACGDPALRPAPPSRAVEREAPVHGRRAKLGQPIRGARPVETRLSRAVEAARSRTYLCAASRAWRLSSSPRCRRAAHGVRTRAAAASRGCYWRWADDAAKATLAPPRHRARRREDRCCAASPRLLCCTWRASTVSAHPTDRPTSIVRRSLVSGCR